ncbi:MAG TPA: DNA polymerase III subunit beta [Deltaproteobacteria bacterium]|nr:DNA polymerase III subunit beta [Candidatus Binatota bacterium]HIL14189.1 DNA polymerase III subunit beta [Deltaproteobacteria bacterium]
MEITLERESFLTVLNRCQGVVDRRHSMPVLTNLVIETDSDSVIVLASDLEIGLRQSCPAQVKKPGTVAVSARKLFEIVREAPDGIELKLKVLKNSWVEVAYGRSDFKLMGIDPSDHPGVSDSPGNGSATTVLSFKVNELLDMIQKTIFAVSTDDTRSNLAGVYLESATEGGLLRMVATDGHRLAMIEKKNSSGEIPSGVILPRKGLNETARILSDMASEADVKLSITANEAFLEAGSAIMSMRLVEGNFPDYNQVVPKKVPHLMVAERDSLLQTVRRVSLLSSERARGIKFSVQEDSLEVSANNPDLGEASEDVKVKYGGDEIEIGFNSRYLLDVLNVLPDNENVEISLKDQLSPGVVRGIDKDYCYVVMPMRI